MTFQSHNPATGELIGTYPEHNEVETDVRLQQGPTAIGIRHELRTSRRRRLK